MYLFLFFKVSTRVQADGRLEMRGRGRLVNTEGGGGGGGVLLAGGEHNRRGQISVKSP